DVITHNTEATTTNKEQLHSRQEVFMANKHAVQPNAKRGKNRLRSHNKTVKTQMCTKTNAEEVEEKDDEQEEDVGFLEEEGNYLGFDNEISDKAQHFKLHSIKVLCSSSLFILPEPVLKEPRPSKTTKVPRRTGSNTERLKMGNNHEKDRADKAEKERNEVKDRADKVEKERNEAKADKQRLEEQNNQLLREKDMEKRKEEEKRKIDETNRSKEKEEKKRIQLEKQNVQK
ncbi:hypothetical protein IRJ41_001036, partial [Triplophysa rosa]